MNEHNTEPWYIGAIRSILRKNCSDHTPFRGACISCGRVDNPDVMPGPDEVISALKSAEPNPSEVPIGAIMEAVAEGMNCAEEAEEDPMSWIQSCVSRLRGVSRPSPEEILPRVNLKPTLPVDEAWKIVEPHIGTCLDDLDASDLKEEILSRLRAKAD